MTNPRRVKSTPCTMRLKHYKEGNIFYPMDLFEAQPHYVYRVYEAAYAALERDLSWFLQHAVAEGCGIVRGART